MVYVAYCMRVVIARSSYGRRVIIDSQATIEIDGETRIGSATGKSTSATVTLRTTIREAIVLRA